MPRLFIYCDSKFVSIYTLLNSETSIGRDKANDVPLPGDPAISSCHALITKRGQMFTIEDRSGNGLSINSSIKETPRPLKNGDNIQIGSYCFEFSEAEKGHTIHNAINNCA